MRVYLHRPLAAVDYAYPRRWSANGLLTDEQRLLTKLMKDYDHSTRPVLNASHPVTVRLGITLNQIFDLVSYGVGHAALKTVKLFLLPRQSVGISDDKGLFFYCR